MSARILVVDDHPGILEVVAYSLRGEGYEVETATDGEQALERAMEDSYDLVVLDLMPPGLSGQRSAGASGRGGRWRSSCSGPKTRSSIASSGSSSAPTTM